MDNNNTFLSNLLLRQYTEKVATNKSMGFLSAMV